MNLTKNGVLVLVVTLGVALAGVYSIGVVMQDKIADRVIEKLQNNYSPSPYGPGVNPDKIDIESIRQNQINPSQPKIESKLEKPELKVDWLASWEDERK